jgi:hypothetical protein
MLAYNCPACKSPSPISLAQPEAVVCEHCGVRSELPHAAVASLRRAAGEIGKLDAQERRLDARQRRAITRSGRYRMLVLALGLTFALPGVFHWWSLVTGYTAERFYELLFVAITSALILAAVFLGLRRVRRARRQMEGVAAAEPPLAEGGAVRCRVCGGEIADLSSGIASCAFCQADNIVTPRVLEQAKQSREVVLGDYRDAVAANARKVGQSSGLAVVGVVLAVFGLPTAFLTVLFMMLLTEPDLPPDLTIEYGLRQVGDRQCLGRLTRNPGGATAIDFGAFYPAGLDQQRFSLPSTQGMVLMRADQLLGRRVYVGDSDQIEVVTKIHYSSIGDVNHIALGQHETQFVEGSCLADVATRQPQSSP